ncbi:MAG: porin family protein [Phormidesmis sp. RL_2_1]|nr:porin family protein [Phormidesmis sp. RL_2_1]
MIDSQPSTNPGLPAQDLGLGAEATVANVAVTAWQQPVTIATEKITSEKIASETIATETIATETIAADTAPAVSFTASSLMAPNEDPEGFITAEDSFDNARLAVAPPVELAQARRRSRSTFRTSNFIGVGVDFGSADDTSFAVISKFSVTDNISIRPAALIGDNFSALVPITYDFNSYSTDLGGFQARPYAGVGASYITRSNVANANNDESELGLLLAAGVDVPVSQSFTANAQLNYSGIFSDNSKFGVMFGVGYNFGSR